MSRFARLAISTCSLRITLVLTRPYLSLRHALVGLGRPPIVKETWSFFFFFLLAAFKKEPWGGRGERGRYRILFSGGFSISLLIPFSVFLIFGMFLHSEGIFSGILFIWEAKREREKGILFFSVAIARRGTTLALLSVLVFKVVVASGYVSFFLLLLLSPGFLFSVGSHGWIG